MKIWYQTAGVLGKKPNYKPYHDMLKNHLQKVARPGTEVSIHGVKTASGPTIQTYKYEELLHHYQIVENCLQAQREGYDAFCVGCALDPGFYAIREVAEIPYCTLAETSMLLACMLSPNFALLCHHKPLMLRVIEYVKRYGLKDRFIECNSLSGVSPADLFRGFDDPEFVLKPAREVAIDAARKGACMFVVAEGILNMIFAKHNIRQIEGIPILEGSSALIKVGEMLVDMKKMGIADASHLGLYTPLPKEDLASMRKLYGLQ